MMSNTTKVSFGEDHFITFDCSMSDAERVAVYYSDEECKEMRTRAIRTVRDYIDGNFLRTTETTRGLEKIMGDRKKIYKRKQNIIKSTLELLEMNQSSAELDERRQTIKEALEAYTKKYKKQAVEKALKLAEQDAVVAHTIYQEQQANISKKSGAVAPYTRYTGTPLRQRRNSLVALSA